MPARNITLAGTLGSGKSTVGKILARRLDQEFISTGMIFRSIGQVADLDALQTNLAAETNTNIDAQVDGFIVERARSPRLFIMDSRMAWHFVPDSFKVYLHASVETSAERILRDTSRETESYATRDDAIRGLAQRRKSEVDRYKRLYSVDIENRANYDAVIVTDGATPDEISDQIIRLMSAPGAARNWIRKDQLVPLMPAPLPGDLAAAASEPLQIALSNGFGFLSADPCLAAAWLRSADAFCPFQDAEAPADQDLLARARALGSAHFAAWDALCGTHLRISQVIGTPAVQG